MADEESTTNTSSSVVFWSIPADDLHLCAEIAKGAGGAVWRAEYLGTQQVAAKELFSTMTVGDGWNDAATLEELAHEAAVLGQLQHDNVVKFLGLCRLPPGRDECVHGGVFIVQELCAGGHLRGLMANAGTIFRDYAEWIRNVHRVAAEIAAGMAYLHSRDLVHRDLKPENILLTQAQGTVRIADFGLTSQRGRLSTESTLQAAAGTMEYMAPETLLLWLNRSRSPCAAKPAVDVYAFGVVLWELLADATVGVANSSLLRGLAQLDRTLAPSLPCSAEWLAHVWEWPAMDQVPSDCPQIFVTVVQRCWQFAEADRPTFRDVAAELVDSAAGLPATGVEVLARQAGCDDAGARSRQPVPVSRDRLAAVSVSAVTEGHLDEPLIAVQSLSPPPSASVLSHRIPPTVPEVHPSVLRGPATALPTFCERQCSRCNLYFPSRFAEAQFSAYVHSDRFFAAAKWPFFALAVAYAVDCAIETAFSDAVGPHAMFRGVESLLKGILFGSAWLFSCPCARTWRRRMNGVVCAVAAVLVLTTCALDVYAAEFVPELQPGSTNFTMGNPHMRFAPPADSEWRCGLMYLPNSAGHELNVCAGRKVWHTRSPKYYPYSSDYNYSYGYSKNPAESYYESYASYYYYYEPHTSPWCLAAVVDHHVVSAVMAAKDVSRVAQLQFVVAYGLFFVEAVTLPVLLTILGLPFRLYAPLVATPAVTALALVCTAFRYHTPITGSFSLVVVAAAVVVIYTSCLASVLSQERAWRSLFVLNSAQQLQSRTLLHDASFRGYRSVMHANRQHSSTIATHRTGPATTELSAVTHD